MGKRIAIIISIIIASVAAFTGGVFGVMALMGKFDEKIIHPTSLEFDADCKIEYNSSEDKLYSFVLHGYNNEDKYAGYDVNQKLCYLDLTDKANLITLCDADGTPLQQNKTNYYEVNCNEPIYYKVNKDSKVIATEAASSTFGCVSFKAKDGRDLVKTSSSFTIWIDRQVKGVYLNADNVKDKSIETPTLTKSVQVVEVKLGDKVYFNYRTAIEKNAANYALTPIKSPSGTILDGVRVGTKVVEAYHLEKDSQAVDSLAEWKELKDCNQTYIGHDEYGYYFLAERTGTYNGFTLAVFDTYDARTIYEAEQAASEQKDSYEERISKMIQTQLSFSVVSSDITSVEFKNTEPIGLNLYADYMQITLNGNRTEQGKINRNLQLEIKEDQAFSNRYDEIDFNSTLNSAIRTDYDQIKFVNIEDEDDEIRYDQGIGITLGTGADADKAYFTLNGQSYTIHFDKNNVTLPGNRKLVKNITTIVVDEAEYEWPVTYTAKTGNVVLTITPSSVVMNVIDMGSYLSFYYYNNQTGTYRPATDFDFAATTIDGTFGQSKSWDIIAKTLPNAENNEILKLGLFIVNSTESEHAWWFASTNVTVDPVELSFEYLNDASRTHAYDLPVTYELNSQGTYDTVYGALAFDEIINIHPEGHLPTSYTSCVFVTSPDNTVVETLPQYTLNLTDLGRNFVLVGCLDANGHFVNSVRIKQGASKQTSLYVLQLKNKYGESTIQTIDGLTSYNLNDIYKNIYWAEDTAVKVTPKYELLDKEGLVNFAFAALKDDLISIDEVNKTVSVYSGNSQSNYGYTITITTTVTGMIKNIMNMLANEPQPDVTKLTYFALFDANDVLIPGGSNLKITNYGYNAETETLVMSYYTEDVVAPGYYFRLCLEYNGVVVKSNKIYILSTDATDIRYNGTNQTISETNPFDNLDVLPASTEEADAQSDDFCFEVSIAVADDNLGYKYSYTAKGFGLTNVTEATFKTLFNAKCDRDTRLGFVATPLIATGHNIRYSTPAGDEDVFSFAYDDNGNVSGINITGIGSTYVIINSTVINRYVKVVVKVETDTTFTLDVPTTRNSENNTFITSDQFITYKYTKDGKTTDLVHTPFITLSNIRISQYGESGATEYPVRKTDDGFDVFIKFVDKEEKLLTITKNGNNWKFARTEYHPNVPLSLVVGFGVLTEAQVKTSTLIFTSSINIVQGTNWPVAEGSADIRIYEGTQINLFEEVHSADATFTGNPLFRIVNLTGGGANVAVYVDDIKQESSTYKFTQIGIHKVEFRYSGAGGNEEIVGTWNNVVVVPNLIMQPKEDVKLSSNSTFMLADLFVLRQYKTDVVYGSISGGESIMYSDEYLADDVVTTYDNIAIKVATDSKINPSTKQVAWIETINDLLGTTETIEVYYGDDIYLGKVNVTIKNKYTEDNLAFTGLSTILAKVKTASFVTYNDETYKLLKSIETNEENLKFTIENGAFTVTDINGKNINSTYKPTYFKFTFFDGTHEDMVLTYTYLCSSQGEVTIQPYTPEFKDAKNPVTTQEYDLINAVINLATMDKTNVESVVVGAVSNEGMFVEDFASKIKGHGYTSSTPSGICNATFKRFEGDTKIITITYTITYKDGVTYEFTKDLVVENEQALTMVYPFADITENLSNSNLNFTSESEKIKFGNTVDLEHTHYEPVLAGSTITFDADDNMFLTRALVADRNGTAITGAISKVEIVGYLYNSVGQTYHSHVKVVGNSVVFESEGITGGTFTYIIIKITTTSQNYNYYVAHVYSTDKQTDYDGVSSNNLYTLSKAYDGIMKDGTKFVDTTLDDIGSQIKPLNNSAVNNVRFYLLNATELNGDVCTTLKDKFNTEVSNLTLSEYLENNKFYTLTIGVVFVKDSVIFNAGRIVANILPTGYYTEEISYLSDLKQTGTDQVTKVQDQPGRYTKDLANNFLDYLPTFSNIKLVEIVEPAEIDCVSIDDKHVHRNFYVLNNQTEFTVKYTFNSDMYIYVTYTYSSVEIDYEETASLATGMFDETNGFVNKFNIKDMGWIKNANTAYTGKITIKFGTKETIIDLSKSNDSINDIDGNNKVSYIYENGEHYLTFAQSNQEYQINFKIIFNDLATPVEKNVSMLVASSLSKPINTGITLSAVVKANNYKGENGAGAVGSQLKVTKTVTDYDKYVISGNNDDSYTIYAAKGSNLYFDVDDASVKYLTGYTLSARPIKLSFGTDAESSTTIDFVHLVNAQKIKISFYVSHDEDAATGTITFYTRTSSASVIKDGLEFNTNVVKSYGGLKTQYVGTSANKEIVARASVTTDTIFNYFFGKLTPVEDAAKNPATHSARIALLDVDGNVVAVDNYNLVDMGFNDGENPNSLIYNYGDAVSPTKDGKLSFANVTTSKGTSVGIENAAGAKTSYEFWITTMAHGTETANGYTALQQTSGENYTTIIVEDKDKTKEFDSGFKNIATIYDVNNKDFYVSALELYLNNDDTSVTLTSISRAYSETNRTVTYYAEFNNYNAYIVYNLDTFTISTRIIRKTSASACFEVAKLTLSAYTDSGLLLKDYEVLYYNFTLSSKYAVQYRHFATVLVNIKDDIKVESNVATTTYTTDLTIAPTKATYTYKYDGSTGEFTGAALTDNRFYTISGWELTPNQVVDDAEIILKFKVSDGKYYLGDLIYNIRIKRNIEILINGNLAETRVTTEYKMQHEVVGEVDKLKDDNLDDNTYETISDSGVYKSNELDLWLIAYDSEGTKTKGKGTGVDGDPLSLSNLTIEIADDAKDRLNGYVEISDRKIVYHKDFTGEIPLVITCSTIDNGDYVIYWTIKVRGVFIFTYVNESTGENTIVNLHDSPLSTGDSVAIVNTDSINNAGIKLTHETSDGVLIHNPAGLLKQPDISTGYLGGLSYVVAKYQTGTSYSATETYNAGTPVFVDVKDEAHPNGAELPVGTLILTQNLPDVTMGGESYVVVYKIDVDYLEQTETYYVSYLVVNNTSMVISKEEQDANIKNVDTLTDNKLYLFGYTTDGETCSPLQNNVLFECVKFTLASYEGIESKYHVRLSNMTGYAASIHSEIYYKLEKEATGNTVKYYIDLGTLYTSYNKGWDKDCITISSDNKLFNNELIADLDIMSNTTKVVGIAGYKDNYKAGFKLKGNTYISSKYSMSLGGMFRSDDTESISFIYTGDIPAADTYFNGASKVEIIEGSEKTYNKFKNTYTLYQLKVSSTNTGSLYNLISTSYYALKSSITIGGNPAVIRPNYDMSMYFIVNIGAETSKFDLKDSIKFYTCTSGGFSDGIVETLYDEGGNIITSIEPSTDLTQYMKDNKELNHFKQTDCTVYLDANTETKVEFTVWWQLPKEITVKFVMGTSDVPTPQDVTVYYGDGNKFGNILPNPTRDGYTFAGWFLNEAYTGDAITSESVVTLAKSTDTTITLYAKWTASA